MALELQFKIKNNPNYQRYLREHSYWYKELNRNKASFPIFEKEVKEEYGLYTVDRIQKAFDTFETISTLLTTLK